MGQLDTAGISPFKYESGPTGSSDDGLAPRELKHGVNLTEALASKATFGINSYGYRDNEV